MRGVVEGFWDCPYCGTNRIRGRYYYCPNCGKGRGKETRFYPPENITEEDLIEDREDIKNPDQYCEFCDSYINFKFKFCPNCGAERGKKNYFDVRGITKPKEERPEEYKQHEESQYEESSPENETAQNQYEKRDPEEEEYTIPFIHEYDEDMVGDRSLDTHGNTDFWSSIIHFFQRNSRPIAIGLAVVAAIFLLVAAFTPRYETVNVTGKSWTRSIDIESYEWVNESGWSLPTGGVLQHTSSEIHHYEKVFDHTESYQESHQERYISGYRTVTHDRGNGYFDVDEEPVYSYKTVYETKYRDVYRDEPVYQTKYYYLIQRWVYNRTYYSSGGTRKPFWPEYELASSDERVGTKHETYTITAMKGDKEKSYTTNLELWQEIATGQTYKFKVLSGTIQEIVENR